MRIIQVDLSKYSGIYTLDEVPDLLKNLKQIVDIAVKNKCGYDKYSVHQSRDWAIEVLSKRDSIKISHKFFREEFYIQSRGGKLYDNEGFRVRWGEFWSGDHNNRIFDTGWFIKEVKI